MACEKVNIQLLTENLCSENRKNFTLICEEKGLIHDETATLALVQTPERLELRKLDEPKLGAVFVDFINGAMAHRRKFGGGRGEAIAKAVGVKKGELPTVIDGTAGLGRDAFVLAAIGCVVKMIERHPVVSLLLQDGLKRAYQDEEMGDFLAEHLQLLPYATLADCNENADVVYLDPMFPHKQKSALVKKEMRVFQHLVGEDLDAGDFLVHAKRLAKKRVVIKRPDYAPFLNNEKPDVSRDTKNHRFDLYITHK